MPSVVSMVGVTSSTDPTDVSTRLCRSEANHVFLISGSSCFKWKMPWKPWSVVTKTSVVGSRSRRARATFQWNKSCAIKKMRPVLIASGPRLVRGLLWWA